ncbi:MAG: hypothetical protein IJO94_03160 [Firmicutes bacterium]|nr:hypothetical protein [Bacillota bacterium]
MSLKVILLFFAGLVYGVVIGLIGEKILNSSAIKAPPRNEKEAKRMARKVTTRWWMKLGLDAVSLFVLFKVVPMMLGAALGIYIMQKVFIFRAIKNNSSQ